MFVNLCDFVQYFAAFSPDFTFFIKNSAVQYVCRRSINRTPVYYFGTCDVKVIPHIKRLTEDKTKALTDANRRETTHYMVRGLHLLNLYIHDQVKHVLILKLDIQFLPHVLILLLDLSL